MKYEKTIKQIEHRLKQIGKLEQELQSLYLSCQATNNQETLKDIIERYNKLNLKYAKSCGKEYVPK
mgnify:CR=1 FL=1